jgi:hypothetical protein
LRSHAERVNSIIVEWRSLGGRAKTTEAEDKNESMGQDASK